MIAYLILGHNMVFLPLGVDVDLDTGNVLVAVTESSLIKKFTNNGSFINSWDGTGSGGELLEFPSDVAVDSHTHDVYVVERGSSRVQKFTSDGNFIKSWGHEGSGDGDFAAPHSIDLDSAGNVFVARHF